ncbi:Tfp pilus assembly protein PilF [Cyclonatronum proteinivorum]|uniref:Tfp pilus assembly protein PilF n=1 Tax=Cyclonatronum proteinivorum TaxID=1457365 RepID=A0A345UPB4_9BACT|nr:tetratricopeptide repeat protein [Cyclonatronum proteinivorum]AXJ02316.1 Tfp pilus assembly protein PilF [Cyclonatronum proteinivorum]
MKFPALFFAFSLVPLVLMAPADSALAQRTPAVAPVVTDSAAVQQQNESEGRRLFVRGITEFEFENYEEAAALLVQAREKLGPAPALDYAIAQSMVEIGNMIDALYYAESAVELAPDNKWYRMTLAEIYQENGRLADSVAQLEIILETSPSDIDVLYSIAQLYMMEGELVPANETLDRIMQITGPEMQLLYQKYRNYVVMGDRESAMDQLERMLELEPDNVAAMQILSQIYIEEAQFSRALELMEQAQVLDPANEETLITLTDLYIREERWDEAGALLVRMIQNPGIETMVKAELVQYLLGQADRDPENESLMEAAGTLVQTFVAHDPELGMAHALAAEYYNMTGDDDRLLESLTRTNELLPENEPAWRQRLQILLSNDRFDEVIVVAQQADEVIPDDAFVLFFKGLAHLLQQSYEEASTILERAAAAPATRPFRSIVYGSLGDALSSMDQHARSDEAYEQSLRLDPDNHTALNNFAYSLSLRQLRLDEALEMSQRAVEAEPDNAAFLDTLGWVYFKLGEYQNAKTYIRASIDTGDASAVVLEHMGDVYEKLEDPANARYWWQKAFDKDETKEHLLEKLDS